MEPIRLTRQEYQELYGEAPGTSTTSTVKPSFLENVSPTPIRMTREEYNARYFPQSQKSNISREVKDKVEQPFFSLERTLSNAKGFVKQAGEAVVETGDAINNILDREQSRAAEIREDFETGRIDRKTQAFQVTGSGLNFMFSTGFEGVIGLGKTILNEKGEEQVKTFFSGWGEAISTQFKKDLESMRTSDVPEERNAAKAIDDFAYYYSNDRTFRNTVDATGGFLDGFLGWTGGTKAKNVIDNALETASNPRRVIEEVNRTFDPPPGRLTPLEERAISSISKEIYNVETRYTNTRRANDRVNDAGDASRRRIAQTVDLNRAVDTDGIIRTTEPGGLADQYFDATLKGAEDVVRRNLINEGRTVNVNELRSLLTIAVDEARLEGADLVAAIKKLDREIEGISIRADEFGEIPLENIQDFKINATKNINYEKPTVQSYQKTLANAYKRIIEDKSGLNIAEINGELAKYYGDLERLKRLDGKRVRGGRLGIYTAQLTGNVVGAGAGMAGGPAGAAIGSILGGEVAGALQGRALSNTFIRNPNARAPRNEILEAAKRRADQGPVLDLKTPDKPFGVPKGVEQNATTRKLEGQIKKNVKAQEKAIKAKDYELVRTLKTIYRSLVETLRVEVRKILDAAGDQRGYANFFGGKPPENYRLSRNQELTKKPTNTAAKNAPITDNKPQTAASGNSVTNIHPEDQEVMRQFIDSVRLKEKDLPPGNEQMLDKLLERWDINPDMDANKIANIFEDILSGKRKVKSTNRLGREFADTATTKTTDLLEEARKYKSAEEFVKAQGTPVYHGTTEKQGKEILADGFKPFDQIPLDGGNGYNYNGQGTYFSDSAIGGKDYGTSVIEAYIPDNLNILEDFNAPTWVKEDTSALALTERLRAEGYDGVKIPTYKGSKEFTLLIFDPEKVKTRKQLEELWKKSQ